MNSYVDFGSRLRQEREARSLSLTELARITKIPERSLKRLEDGAFDMLPGDVFVRGFLRSYARCVGLDPEELVRKFCELVSRRDKPKREQVLSASIQEELEIAPSPSPGDSPTQQINLIAKTLAGAGGGTKRVSLTMAVIILVIVATLTLSLLLRRPNHVGEGVLQSGARSDVTDNGAAFPRCVATTSSHDESLQG
ncbi:MAG: helix-turn-helix domain-containing protein [Deltaproteobacteria bacterium]|nr:helix-turn-helix domain-containing protein [Deltaproteobacteria bacterium]